MAALVAALDDRPERRGRRARSCCRATATPNAPALAAARPRRGAGGGGLLHRRYTVQSRRHAHAARSAGRSRARCWCAATPPRRWASSTPPSSSTRTRRTSASACTTPAGESCYVPAARAIHHDQLNTDPRGARRRIVEFHRNRDRYMRKHHGPPTRLAVRALGALVLPRARGRAWRSSRRDTMPGRYLLHARQELRARPRGRASARRPRTTTGGRECCPVTWNTPTSPSSPQSWPPPARPLLLAGRGRVMVLGGLLLLGPARPALLDSALGHGALDRLASPAGGAAGLLGVVAAGRAPRRCLRRAARLGAAGRADRGGAAATTDRPSSPAEGFPLSLATERPARAAAAALLRARRRRARARVAGLRRRTAPAPSVRCRAWSPGRRPAFLAFACLSLMWADQLGPGGRAADLLHDAVRAADGPWWRARRFPTGRRARMARDRRRARRRSSP